MDEPSGSGLTKRQKKRLQEKSHDEKFMASKSALDDNAKEEANDAKSQDDMERRHLLLSQSSWAFSR